MIDGEALRADLVKRIQNAVNDLRNEWFPNVPHPATIAFEVTETATGVSVSLVVKVGAESSDKKEDGYTPLSKKRV